MIRPPPSRTLFPTRRSSDLWRVQHARYEDNQSWNNGQDGISLGHKDTDNTFLRNVVTGNARTGVYFRDERDRKSTRLNSSHGSISYAVFCLKKKKKTN